MIYTDLEQPNGANHAEPDIQLARQFLERGLERSAAIVILGSFPEEGSMAARGLEAPHTPDQALEILLAQRLINSINR